MSYKRVFGAKTRKSATRKLCLAGRKLFICGRAFIYSFKQSPKISHRPHLLAQQAAGGGPEVVGTPSFKTIVDRFSKLEDVTRAIRAVGVLQCGIIFGNIRRVNINCRVGVGGGGLWSVILAAIFSVRETEMKTLL